MSLQPLDAELIKQLNGNNPVPLAPLPDFGISFRKEKQSTPKKLTADEANRLFGVSQAVKMNFVPQMIIAIALDQISQFVNYCREQRIKDFRKHNRLMQQCVEEYAARLAKSYGKAFGAYTSYAERYFQYVEADRVKMWFSVGNIVNRQIADETRRVGASHIAIIHNLINYAESYDRKMDRLIADTVKSPVYRKQDVTLSLIVAMCIEFEETWGFKIEPDPIVDMNIRVLANRAESLADIIIKEENVSKS